MMSGANTVGTASLGGATCAEAWATGGPLNAMASFGRRQRLLGPVVVFGVVLLQLATDLVAGRGDARMLFRLAFLSCIVPALMVALTGVFRWSVRRGMTAPRALGAGVAVATCIGTIGGLIYGAVAAHQPEIRAHFPNGAVSFPRSVAFGIVNAQLYFGIWALAFVYPFAVEGAGLRLLEARHLRSQAELARLRSHLEPHFLLNTLNAIAGLVTEDPREARRLLVCLGDLLRDAVRDSGDMQPLDRQIAWLRRYAEILEARHHGALRFRWDVDPDCGSALLPRFLLQPLVENAVKHGALQRGDRAGEVTVRASRRSDGGFVCAVEDNGPGMQDTEVRQGAFGLLSVRRRLELEAPEASLRLVTSSRGTQSIVEVRAKGARA